MLIQYVGILLPVVPLSCLSLPDAIGGQLPVGSAVSLSPVGFLPSPFVAASLDRPVPSRSDVIPSVSSRAKQRIAS